MFHVVVPGVVPPYAVHAYPDRLGRTYLVVAELIGEKSGLSPSSTSSRCRHFTTLRRIIIIGVAGLAVDQLLALGARYLFPWESGNTRLARLARGVRRVLPDRLAPVRVI
jgi:ABC-type nitrate/sulfonate/bicarbonate transport system permease component